MAEHLSGYQARDLEVTDYDMTLLPGTELMFRGPLHGAVAQHTGIVCLGAAQTFGCFTDEPFPDLLGASLGTPVLNLGYGGAGPRFYLRHPELIDYANRAELVVLQVMSGRSESNSRFESGGLEYLVRRSDGARVSAREAYRGLLLGEGQLPSSLTGRAVRSLARPIRRARTARVVTETRRNWVQSYRELFAQITTPTVLLWFAQRRPEYNEDYRSVAALFSDFPQLVNREMVDAVAPLAGRYVECVTRRGSPQPLLSRFTGEPITVDPAQDRADLAEEPWTHNRYYPSPEMHHDAAAALLEPCRSMLEDRR